MGAVKTVGIGALGGGGAFLANKYLISKLGTNPDGSSTQYGMPMRMAARALASILAGFFLQGRMEPIASAINGGMAYGAASELDAWWAARATSADLSDVEADLSDVLDGIY